MDKNVIHQIFSNVPVEGSYMPPRIKFRNMPQSIPTLQELAFMYGTDKLEHGYMDFYEQHLPKNPKKILEIGVREGRSIKMWMHRFPDAIIHGLDLFKEFPVPFTDERVKWHIGNQCDWELLEQLRKEDFDVIIDDGSHNSRDQMMTFFGLFNGKHYFIEDLQCCEEEFWRQGLPVSATALRVFCALWPSEQLSISGEGCPIANIVRVKNP